MSIHDGTELPETIESIVEVPVAARGLYERTGSSYELTDGGKFLHRVKHAIAEHRAVEYAPQKIWEKEPTEIELADWSRTMAAASGDERRSLLQLAAAGKVAIKR